MGKHEKGTPKEIANRCKSKGLQKLRWFCQMCQKQCRDQNGFKCHLTSEAHQRQLLLFAENPHTYLKEYSQDFEKNFITATKIWLHLGAPIHDCRMGEEGTYRVVLRNTFGTKRVRANEVYQEYIRDKMHVHMNSTEWHTLTNFVHYLGTSGKCRVDHTEKGWFIALVDQEEEMRKKEAVQKAKASQDDEQRHLQLLEQQAERAREKLRGEEVNESKPSELRRTDDDEKVAFSMGPKKPNAEDLSRPSTSLLASASSVFETKPKVKKEEHDRDEPSTSRKRRFSDEKDVKDRQDSRKDSRDRHGGSRSREKMDRESRSDERNEPRRGSERNVKKEDIKPKKSALDEIREMEERKKERDNRKDYWLHKDIIVKVITKKLGEEYYKAKGVVKTVIDDYSALVAIDDAVLKLDQSHVETVIPAVGRKMHSLTHSNNAIIITASHMPVTSKSLSELNPNAVLKLDQSHVETVIPAVGRKMLVVNGAYRDTKALLEAINERQFSLSLRLDEGLAKGRVITVPYEDASKLA